MEYPEHKVTVFLYESNKIENEESSKALQTSLTAWNHLRHLKILTIEDLLTCHLLLMGSLNPNIAGMFRTVSVRIGGACGYPPYAVQPAIRNWLTVANLVNTEEKIKDNHIWFELIHPFVDGNGRVGRMVLLWQRQRAKLPFEIIEAATKHEKYYPWFTQQRYLGKYKYKG